MVILAEHPQGPLENALRTSSLIPVPLYHPMGLTSPFSPALLGQNETLSKKEQDTCLFPQVLNYVFSFL